MDTIKLNKYLGYEVPKGSNDLGFSIYDACWKHSMHLPIKFKFFFKCQLYSIY